MIATCPLLHSFLFFPGLVEHCEVEDEVVNNGEDGYEEAHDVLDEHFIFTIPRLSFFCNRSERFGLLLALYLRVLDE